VRHILLIGSVGVGKTTLRQAIHGEDLDYAKTQAIEVKAGVVDTPGEFLESRFYKHALITASYSVDTVVLVQAADERGTRFPPGFSTAFNRPVIGVITKSGLGTPETIHEAEGQLRLAGARDVFIADAFTGEGMDELKETLCQPSTSAI